MSFNRANWQAAIELTEKPWPIELAQARYVYGTRINFEQLAQESGCSLGTIKRYSSNADPTWNERRDMEGQKLAADLTEGIHQTAAAITKSVHEGAIADFKMGLEGWIKAQMEAIRDDKVERAWDHLRLTSVMREKLVRFTETDFEITTVRQAADVAKVITTIEQHAYQLLDEATGLGKLNEMMSAIERALPQDDAIDVDPSE